MSRGARQGETSASRAATGEIARKRRRSLGISPRATSWRPPENQKRSRGTWDPQIHKRQARSETRHYEAISHAPQRQYRTSLSHDSRATNSKRFGQRKGKRHRAEIPSQTGDTTIEGKTVLKPHRKPPWTTRSEPGTAGSEPETTRPSPTPAEIEIDHGDEQINGIETQREATGDHP